MLTIIPKITRLIDHIYANLGQLVLFVVDTYDVEHDNNERDGEDLNADHNVISKANMVILTGFCRHRAN